MKAHRAAFAADVDSDKIGGMVSMAGEHSSQISHYRPAAPPPDDLPAAGIAPAAAAPALPPVVIAFDGEPPPSHQEDKTVISNRPPLRETPPLLLASGQSIGQSLLGKSLDHYELVEFVGGGGMGAVFRANDTRLGRTVAVKVLSCAPTDEETIRRFRNEAQSAARLDHPNIARVYFVGESQGQNYIVFEFIEGVNLRDLVAERGPLPIENALSYTLQIAEALEHSSSRDVVHRDIKPSNALVTGSGLVKLVDMGLARLHQVESSSDDLTASGVTLGTFDYISPEQARDPRAADVRSDLYSLGCTLYYMLAGQPPFPEGSAVQKLLRHSSEEPPDVRLFRPDVPPQVVALLGKLLAKRPSQRYQTPAELVAALVNLGQQLSIPDLAQRGTAVMVSPPAADWRGKALQIVLAMVLLVASIGALDAWLSAGNANEFSLRSNLGPPAAIVIPAGDELDGPAASATGDSAGAPVATGNASGSGSVGSNGTDAASIADGSLTPAASDSPSALQPEVVAVANSLPLPGAATGAITAITPPTAALVGPDPQAATVGIEPASAAIDVTAEPAIGLAAPGPGVKIRRIAVALQPPSLIPPDVEYVSSLADACRRAAELGISDVELQWNGRLAEAPFEVTNQGLSLRTSPGFRPILVFTPTLGLAADREMIRLRGGGSSSLSIQGLELRLELPADPSFGWSLLSISTGQTLSLADCVLTVQDGDASRPAVHDQVAMIAVQGRRPSEMMTMGKLQPSMAAPTSLMLDRCIARGDATVIGMPEETPLTIRWNQGLIVTPRRFMETGGTMTSPTVFENIAIYLASVTASCRQGFYQMKRRAGAGFQLSLDVTAERCILMTDRDSPLYEFIGVAEVTADDLKCLGEENLYPELEAVFLRHRSGLPNDVSQSYPLKQRGLIWSQERNPQVGNPWAEPIDLSLPASARTKEDFVLDDPSDKVGFDSESLPNISSSASGMPPVATPAGPPAEPSPAGDVPAES